ncbi:hypothetical protein HDU67_009713 [Dinochytrium kinnereticum]|nr:hypothetical protein HDU67_009713 [Dinochytrium kinnereticum]
MASQICDPAAFYVSSWAATPSTSSTIAPFLSVALQQQLVAIGESFSADEATYLQEFLFSLLVSGKSREEVFDEVNDVVKEARALTDWFFTYVEKNRSSGGREKSELMIDLDVDQDDFASNNESGNSQSAQTLKGGQGGRKRGLSEVPENQQQQQQHQHQQEGQDGTDSSGRKFKIKRIEWDLDDKSAGKQAVPGAPQQPQPLAGQQIGRGNANAGRGGANVRDRLGPGSRGVGDRPMRQLQQPPHQQQQQQGTLESQPQSIPVYSSDQGGDAIIIAAGGSVDSQEFRSPGRGGRSHGPGGGFPMDSNMGGQFPPYGGLPGQGGGPIRRRDGRGGGQYQGRGSFGGPGFVDPMAMGGMGMGMGMGIGMGMGMGMGPGGMPQQQGWGGPMGFQPQFQQPQQQGVMGGPYQRGGMRRGGGQGGGKMRGGFGGEWGGQQHQQGWRQQQQQGMPGMIGGPGPHGGGFRPGQGGFMRGGQQQPQQGGPSNGQHDAAAPPPEGDEATAAGGATASNGSTAPMDPTTAALVGEFGEPVTRCSFWPSCGKGDACKFWHPREPCRDPVRCPNTRLRCRYLHPEDGAGLAGGMFGGGAASAGPGGVVQCRFGAACTRPHCKFSHPSPASIAAAAAAAGGGGGPGAPKCRFWPNCANPVCPYFHPASTSLTLNNTAAAATSSSAGGENANGTATTPAAGEGDETTQPATDATAASTTTVTPSPATTGVDATAKIPCRFEPFCNRPGCPFAHAEGKARGGGGMFRGGNRSVVFNQPKTVAAAHVSERSFAVPDGETERVVVGGEVNGAGEGAGKEGENGGVAV